MLILSEVLLEQGGNILSFNELKKTVQTLALAHREIHFSIDIEPPAYPDRPNDWYDQLEITFSSAG